MTGAFELTDRHVDELATLSPPLATALGIPGHDHEWGDGFGVGGVEAQHDLNLRHRDELAPFLGDSDPKQSLAAQVSIRSIDEQLTSYEAGDHFRAVSHMASPFHGIRSIFDIMPSDSSEAWENITARLETIDKPHRDYRELLDIGRQKGIVAASRQIRSLIEQTRILGGAGSAYLSLISKAEAGGFSSERLRSAVDHARSQVATLGDWLEASYLPFATDQDAAGPEVYQRWADRLVGVNVDPEEAYQWGWEEFRRLLAEMELVGDQIVPGAGFAEVKEFLEHDPSGMANGTEELLEFVDRILAEAVDELSGSHFDVPEPIRALTTQIAPPGGPLMVYYTTPSEDFVRPGGVWYSIGDQSQFPLYQHVSTAYHEGFPGHHLQLATAMYHKEDLSRVQRTLTFYPGHSEGWAMYAEVLMGELGYLENPKHYFGMLAKQMYRAARVVVDIGLHLGKPIAESSPIDPGRAWSFDSAVEFMETYGFRTSAQAEAEALRYLGWPGQAIAYKLGEREILSIRSEARDRLGAAFDLRQFHEVVLTAGGMRLDMLRQVVRERMPGQTHRP